MSDKNVIPQGVVIGEKPFNIEELAKQRGGKGRSTGRWMNIARTLPLIARTKTVRVDIKGKENKHLYYIKKIIRDSAKKLGIKEEIRFARDNTILHVWIN